MIYKQKNNLVADEHFFENFLKERNISDLPTFLHPTENELYDFMLLDNIIELNITYMKGTSQCASSLTTKLLLKTITSDW